MVTTKSRPLTDVSSLQKNTSLLWDLQEVMIVAVESDVKLSLIVTAVSMYVRVRVNEHESDLAVESKENFK